MRCRALTTGALTTGAAALLAGAGLAPAAQAAPPLYSAHVSRCHSALTAAARSEAVTAKVRAPAQSATVTRVGVRLHLLVHHAGDTGFRAYASPDPSVKLSALGLDTWVKSDPGKPALRYTHVINNLDAPAVYRFRVGFRSYDAQGRVLHTHSRVTGTCVQRDLRPDLAVQRVTVTPLGARRAVYKVVVRNRGHTPAGAFAVTLAVGDRLVTRSVPGLAAGRLAKVGFGLRPACDPAARPVVTLDPDGAVDEADEADDVVPVACP